jgi:hypothetical protein
MHSASPSPKYRHPKATLFAQSTVQDQRLHNRAIGCRPRQVTIDVLRPAAVLSSPSSIVPVIKVTHKPIVHNQAVAQRAVSTTDCCLRTIRSRQPMVIPKPVNRQHRSTRRQRHARNQWHACRHRRPKSHTRTPTVHRQWYVTPRTRNNVTSSKVAANQLITTPRSLHHFNSLTVCKTPVALRAGVWRCNQGLVGLPVCTTQEVG